MQFLKSTVLSNKRSYGDNLLVNIILSKRYCCIGKSVAFSVSVVNVLETKNIWVSINENVLSFCKSWTSCG